MITWWVCGFDCLFMWFGVYAVRLRPLGVVTLRVCCGLDLSLRVGCMLLVVCVNVGAWFAGFGFTLVVGYVCVGCWWWLQIVCRLFY